MPIYEYKCHKCGEHFEVNQRISDNPLKKHNNESKCGGKVEKLISANTFHLKGGGWYKTDYAKPSSSAPAPKKKEEGSSSTAEAKKESSPEPAKKETASATKD